MHSLVRAEVGINETCQINNPTRVWRDEGCLALETVAPTLRTI